MKVAFIGYGNMTKALAARWHRKHDLFIGGRDVAKAAAVAGELGIQRHGDNAAAARFGDVVVLATPHDQVFSAIESAGGAAAFAGKVIVDINNPVPGYRQNDFTIHTYGDGRSLAEEIQRVAPEAHVVKAFNMAQATVWTLDPPVFDGRQLAMLMAGDNAGAKASVADLVRLTGCDPFDIGPLKYARHLEAAAAIVIQQLFGGADPRTVLNLIRPEVKPI